ncbi:MAG: chemotaxis protein CheW [Phycisphaerales bacterium]
MRTFVFTAAGCRYALDASWVQAVHPLVRARPVPGAPPFIAGMIDVHGELVPLVDAALLLSGSQPVERTLGARVLLLDTGGAGARARFALAVDRVVDVADLDEEGSRRMGARTSPWLGAVLHHQGEATQLFDATALATQHPQLASPDACSIAQGEPA